VSSQYASGYASSNGVGSNPGALARVTTARRSWEMVQAYRLVAPRESNWGRLKMGIETPLADYTTILTPWTLPDDLRERVEWAPARYEKTSENHHRLLRFACAPYWRRRPRGSL
jgi:hypothetical protein